MCLSTWNSINGDVDNEDEDNKEDIDFHPRLNMPQSPILVKQLAKNIIVYHGYHRFYTAAKLL